MRYRLRTLMIVLAIVGVVFGTARILFWAVASHITPTLEYEIRAEFAEMPAEDDNLRQWIEEQPGVHTAETTREQSVIRIVWSMSRDLTGHPPLPDFHRNFERFGYRELRKFEELH